MKAIILSAVLFVLSACGQPSAPPSSAPPAKPAAQGEIDPVCGMKVAGGTGVRSKHSGKEFAFCSAECAAKFEKDPDRFSMGYCDCAVDMPKCKCGHCVALKSGTAPTEACPCHEEEESHEGHNH